MANAVDILTGPLSFRAAEVGTDGSVSLYHIADLLQEFAGIHAEKLGFGMSHLAELDLTWALTSLRIHLSEPINGSGHYQLHTWPSGTERLWAFRRFLITQDGRECGQALSRWLMLHRENHRPSRLPSFMADRIWPDAPVAEHQWREFENPQLNWEIVEEFSVRFTEIDTNGHVNNAHYLAWCLNASPKQLLNKSLPLETEIHFEAEAKWGDPIQVWLHTDRDRTTHYRVMSGERRLAVVHFYW